MQSLVIAIIFGSLFAILFKLFQRHNINALQAIAVNYAVAFVIGLIGNITQGATAVALDEWIVPASLVGLAMMGGFVTMNYATRSHGVAVATIAARVAFVIPVLCAYLFLQGDEPRWVASALVIASLLLIFHHRQETQASKGSILNPIPVFICYGMANFLLKLCQQIVAQAGGNNADLSLISSVAFLAALIFTIIYYYLQPATQRSALTRSSIMAGVVLGIVNMGCTFFLLKSLMSIDSSIFYPVYNIAIVLIATLTGRFYFGERLSKWQYSGIAVAIVAIILFFV